MINLTNEEMSKIVIDSIDNELSSEMYHKLLRRDNCLISFDVINRLLIQSKCSSAYDVKTESEWNIVGRELNKKATPINIVVPKYKYRYIDNLKGKALKKNDLSSNEIIKALEYGIITKDISIEDISIEKVYDIRDTHSINNSEYKFCKPVLSKKSLIGLYSNITNCKLEISDKCYYDKTKNTLYISNVCYTELARFLSNLIVEHYLIGILNSKDIYEHRDLIIESFRYSLNSLIGIQDSNKKIDGLDKLNKFKLIYTLSIVDEAICSIINLMRFDGTCSIKDAYSSINNNNKAEIILNIMESNLVSKKLNK